MKSYAEYLSLLDRDVNGELTDCDIVLLAGAMLDGGVPDVELGALLSALRARSDSADLLLGVLRALQPRVTRWSAPAPVCPVSLACYGGAGRVPDLTPLLALLLARFGIPVLLHGPLHALSGISVSLVLRELGVMPCPSKESVSRELHERGLAFVPDTLLAPGLAGLLSYRARLGALPLLVSAARLVDPFDTGSLVVAAAEEESEIERLKAAIAAHELRALVFLGTEGEPFASPSVRPRMESWRDGVATVLFEGEVTPSPRSVVLPAAADVRGVAAWIRQVLDGSRAMPTPLVNQLAACLYGTGYCEDFNQAKALAAIAAARRRVA